MFQNGFTLLSSESQLDLNNNLDEVAPIKTFNIKSTFKFGLSESTKELIQKRDHTRSLIKNSTNQEKEFYSSSTRN